jgi:hypothetical protein
MILRNSRQAGGFDHLADVNGSTLFMDSKKVERTYQDRRKIVSEACLYSRLKHLKLLPYTLQ